LTLLRISRIIALPMNASVPAPAPALEQVRYQIGIWSSLRELASHWELIRGLIIRDLKVRYRNSVLGFFWSMLTPILQMAILAFVVKFAMQVPIENLTVKLLTGIIAWHFFENGLQDCADCVLNNRDLVKKIYFPRAALPIAVVIGNLIHFLLSLVVLLIWLAAVGDTPHRYFLYLFPLIILQTLLIAGLGLMLAALHTFYHDIKFIIIQLLRVFFFLTPVMYTADLLAGKLHITLPQWAFTLYMLNPMATLIESYRTTLIGHQSPQWVFFLPVAVICLVMFIVGYHLYLKLAWRFAEAI
jgi:lipopolysaccharide transport system permease protein